MDTLSLYQAGVDLLAEGIIAPEGSSLVLHCNRRITVAPMPSTALETSIQFHVNRYTVRSTYPLDLLVQYRTRRSASLYLQEVCEDDQILCRVKLILPQGMRIASYCVEVGGPPQTQNLINLLSDLKLHP